MDFVLSILLAALRASLGGTVCFCVVGLVVDFRVHLQPSMLVFVGCGVCLGMLRWCWVIVYRRIAYISTFSNFKHFKSCLLFIFKVSFLRVRQRTFRRRRC